MTLIAGALILALLLVAAVTAGAAIAWPKYRLVGFLVSGVALLLALGVASGLVLLISRM